jgi:formate-dependent nitrite reductase membrane component NrfD
MDAWLLALEFIVLIAFIVSLGPVSRAWLSVWGFLLLFGVVIVGILIPLALYWRRQWLGDLSVTTAAALVLLGGFLLRFIIVFAGEAV